MGDLRLQNKDLIVLVLAIIVRFRTAAVPAETSIGDAIMKELFLLTGLFKDYTELDIFAAYLNKFRSELYQCIEILQSKEELSDSDLHFLKVYPDLKVEYEFEKIENL